MPANPYLDSFSPVGAVAEPDVALPPTRVRIERATTAASDWLLARQVPQGWWCGTLEGDSTLESYLILLETFLGRRTEPRVARFAARVRSRARPGGGWGAYPEGPADLSVSCLAYFALKVAG